MFKLFREPEKGEFFVCGADPSEGGDYCSGTWKSKKYADTVLSYHARIESTQFGYELEKGSRFLFKKTGLWPCIGVERNTGMATIAKLIDLNYPNLFKMKSFDRQTQKEEEKIGWHTNSATRPKLLDDHALSIRQGVNKIFDKTTVNEHMTFIRNPKTGKPEAEVGMNDDTVFSEGIAWQLYQIVPMPMETYVIPRNDISRQNWSLE